MARWVRWIFFPFPLHLERSQDDVVCAGCRSVSVTVTVTVTETEGTRRPGRRLEGADFPVEVDARVAEGGEARWRKVGLMKGFKFAG